MKKFCMIAALATASLGLGALTAQAGVAPSIGEAAKSVAGKLEFQPATVKGTPVTSRVVLPLLFKP